MKIAIRNSLITWGIPILVASIPYTAWINEVAEIMRMIGWRGVAIGTSLHAFLTTLFIIKWINLKRDKDYHQYLEPVPEQGYSIDKRNGQAVCPKCNSENRLNYMASIAKDSQYPRHKCNVCGTTVWKDGRVPPPPKKNIYKFNKRKSFFW